MTDSTESAPASLPKSAEEMPHPAFPQPGSRFLAIWRYLDLDKFLSTEQSVKLVR